MSMPEQSKASKLGTSESQRRESQPDQQSSGASGNDIYNTQQNTNFASADSSTGPARSVARAEWSVRTTRTIQRLAGMSLTRPNAQTAITTSRAVIIR
jgi:hypothetical protein